MNDFQIEKIKAFVRDELMMTSVLNVIRDAFLDVKMDKDDVHKLASRSLALDMLLKDAKKELERFKEDKKDTTPVHKQLGL